MRCLKCSDNTPAPRPGPTHPFPKEGGRIAASGVPQGAPARKSPGLPRARAAPFSSLLLVARGASARLPGSRGTQRAPTGSRGCQRGGLLASVPHASPGLSRPRGGGLRVFRWGSGAPRTGEREPSEVSWGLGRVRSVPEPRCGPSLSRRGAGRRPVPGRGADPWVRVGGSGRGGRQRFRICAPTPLRARPWGRGGRDNGRCHLRSACRGRAGPRDVCALCPRQQSPVAGRPRNPILRTRQWGPKELAQGHELVRARSGIRDPSPCRCSPEPPCSSPTPLRSPQFPRRDLWFPEVVSGLTENVPKVPGTGPKRSRWSRSDSC